jgi:hypothetical protein
MKIFRMADMLCDILKKKKILFEEKLHSFQMSLPSCNVAFTSEVRRAMLLSV